MRLYSNKRLQLTIIFLYPLLIFVILAFAKEIGTWIFPMSISLLFCFLWKNVRNLMFSTLIMWVVSVPLWYFLIERNRESQSAAIFSASLPLIFMEFIIVVFIPEIIIILIRNALIRRFILKGKYIK